MPSLPTIMSILFRLTTLLLYITTTISVFARIESGQGADLGKGHFCVRSIILRALLRVILHFEGTMGK